jgi:hypothetical protein
VRIWRSRGDTVHAAGTREANRDAGIAREVLITHFADVSPWDFEELLNALWKVF